MGTPGYAARVGRDGCFTEEQFEVYRALGYHVVGGYFSNTDEVSWLSDGHGSWPNVNAAKAAVQQALTGD